MSKTGIDELEEIRQLITSAERAWRTFGAILKSSYLGAYKFHFDTLAEIKEQRKANSKITYYVLSTVCAGLAGGVVGAIMAPWVTSAGLGIAIKFRRETEADLYIISISLLYRRASN
jgi:hypothetical protein